MLDKILENNTAQNDSSVTNLDNFWIGIGIGSTSESSSSYPMMF